MADTYQHSPAPTRLVLTDHRSRLATARSDAELVGASVRDPDAFTELFARHWDGLYRFCLNRAGSAGEDVAAEAFRVAFDRRRRYDVRYHDARPWLFGIATNLLREHFRTAGREESKRSRAAALETLTQADGELGGLERQLLGPHLAAALRDLPAADRDALLLLAWADLNYEQIAQALDIPPGTVGSRVHRARQRVREYLQTGEDHEARTERGLR
ncbi:MAG: RNA polymerase sigma factor [Solirubrobacteraceae bacterium]